jgi:low affinity Fe/Cu permease
MLKIMIMLVVMIMVMISVLTGRGFNLSTTWLTMITTAGLAEYDSPPQISD